MTPPYKLDGHRKCIVCGSEQELNLDSPAGLWLLDLPCPCCQTSGSFMWPEYQIHSEGPALWTPPVKSSLGVYTFNWDTSMLGVSPWGGVTTSHQLTTAKPQKRPKLRKSKHAGLIIGFRYWDVSAFTLGPLGVTMNPWTRGPNEARCYYGHGHKVPNKNCECGLYLRAEPTPADAGDHSILGACLAWGRILMHGTAGARVQHARPILLAYDPAWTKAKQGVVKGLAQDYDCRTVPVSYPDVERGVCDELLQAAREYGKLMGEMETT